VEVGEGGAQQEEITEKGKEKNETDFFSRFLFGMKGAAKKA
jgi:hypothetical protein